MHCIKGLSAFPKCTAHIYEYLNIDREIVNVLSENRILNFTYLKILEINLAWLRFAREIYSWPEVRWLSVFHHMPKKKSFFRFAVDLLLICPSFRWATLLSVSDVEKGPIKVIEDLVWPSQHGWSIYQSLLFFPGQIHSTIWTNTFYNLNKYPFQHGQIHSTIETNTFDQGSGLTIPTWLVHLSKSPHLPLKAEENNPIPPNPLHLPTYLIATLRYVSNWEMSTVLLKPF